MVTKQILGDKNSDSIMCSDWSGKLFKICHWRGQGNDPGHYISTDTE